MPDKPSFKEYLNSKKALLNAIDNTPEELVEYEVKTYCNLPVDEHGEKQKVKLKPRNKLFISWLYKDKDHPVVKDIQFEGTDMDNTSLDSYWTEERLLKWLIKNTEKHS